jgi:hypothetical protein
VPGDAGGPGQQGAGRGLRDDLALDGEQGKGKDGRQFHEFGSPGNGVAEAMAIHSDVKRKRVPAAARGKNLQANATHDECRDTREELGTFSKIWKIFLDGARKIRMVANTFKLCQPFRLH